MVLCIFWCFLVVVLFWYTLSVKNAGPKKGKKSTVVTRNTTQTTTMNAGAESSGHGQTTTKKGEKKNAGASTKIEEKGQKLIQKAVMRIAWYPVVPLVFAMPLAMSLSSQQLSPIWEFTWFSTLMCNFQVSESI
jgi:hypothetical protein